MVDAINDEALTYSLNGGLASGGFTWNLHFTWEKVKESPDRKQSTDPLRLIFDTAVFFYELRSKSHSLIQLCLK